MKGNDDMADNKIKIDVDEIKVHVDTDEIKDANKQLEKLEKKEPQVYYRASWGGEPQTQAREPKLINASKQAYILAGQEVNRRQVEEGLKLTKKQHEELLDALALDYQLVIESEKKVLEENKLKNGKPKNINKASFEEGYFQSFVADDGTIVPGTYTDEMTGEHRFKKSLKVSTKEGIRVPEGVRKLLVGEGKITEGTTDLNGFSLTALSKIYETLHTKAGDNKEAVKLMDRIFSVVIEAYDNTGNAELIDRVNEWVARKQKGDRELLEYNLNAEADRKNKENGKGPTLGIDVRDVYQNRGALLTRLISVNENTPENLKKIIQKIQDAQQKIDIPLDEVDKGVGASSKDDRTSRVAMSLQEAKDFLSALNKAQDVNKNAKKIMQTELGGVVEDYVSRMGDLSEDEIKGIPEVILASFQHLVEEYPKLLKDVNKVLRQEFNMELTPEKGIDDTSLDQYYFSRVNKESGLQHGREVGGDAITFGTERTGEDFNAIDREILSGGRQRDSGEFESLRDDVERTKEDEEVLSQQSGEDGTTLNSDVLSYDAIFQSLDSLLEFIINALKNNKDVDYTVLEKLIKRFKDLTTGQLAFDFNPKMDKGLIDLLDNVQMLSFEASQESNGDNSNYRQTLISNLQDFRSGKRFVHGKGMADLPKGEILKDSVLVDKIDDALIGRFSEESEPEPEKQSYEDAPENIQEMTFHDAVNQLKKAIGKITSQEDSGGNSSEKIREIINKILDEADIRDEETGKKLSEIVDLSDLRNINKIQGESELAAMNRFANLLSFADQVDISNQAFVDRVNNNAGKQVINLEEQQEKWRQANPNLAGQYDLSRKMKQIYDENGGLGNLTQSFNAVLDVTNYEQLTETEQKTIQRIKDFFEAIGQLLTIKTPKLNKNGEIQYDEQGNIIYNEAKTQNIQEKFINDLFARLDTTGATKNPNAGARKEDLGKLVRGENISTGGMSRTDVTKLQKQGGYTGFSYGGETLDEHIKLAKDDLERVKKIRESVSDGTDEAIKLDAIIKTAIQDIERLEEANKPQNEAESGERKDRYSSANKKFDENSFVYFDTETTGTGELDVPVTFGGYRVNAGTKDESSILDNRILEYKTEAETWENLVEAMNLRDKETKELIDSSLQLRKMFGFTSENNIDDSDIVFGDFDTFKSNYLDLQLKNEQGQTTQEAYDAKKITAQELLNWLIKTSENARMVGFNSKSFDIPKLANYFTKNKMFVSGSDSDVWNQIFGQNLDIREIFFEALGDSMSNGRSQYVKDTFKLQGLMEFLRGQQSDTAHEALSDVEDTEYLHNALKDKKTRKAFERAGNIRDKIMTDYGLNFSDETGKNSDEFNMVTSKVMEIIGEKFRTDKEQFDSIDNETIIKEIVDILKTSISALNSVDNSSSQSKSPSPAQIIQREKGKYLTGGVNQNLDDIDFSKFNITDLNDFLNNNELDKYGEQFTEFFFKLNNAQKQVIEGLIKQLKQGQMPRDKFESKYRALLDYNQNQTQAMQFGPTIEFEGHKFGSLKEAVDQNGIEKIYSDFVKNLYNEVNNIKNDTNLSDGEKDFKISELQTKFENFFNSIQDKLDEVRKKAQTINDEDNEIQNKATIISGNLLTGKDRVDSYLTSVMVNNPNQPVLAGGGSGGGGGNFNNGVFEINSAVVNIKEGIPVKVENASSVSLGDIQNFTGNALGGKIPQALEATFKNISDTLANGMDLQNKALANLAESIRNPNHGKSMNSLLREIIPNDEITTEALEFGKDFFFDEASHTYSDSFGNRILSSTEIRDLLLYGQVRENKKEDETRFKNAMAGKDLNNPLKKEDVGIDNDKTFNEQVNAIASGLYGDVFHKIIDVFHKNGSVDIDYKNDTDYQKQLQEAVQGLSALGIDQSYLDNIEKDVEAYKKVWKIMEQAGYSMSQLSEIPLAMRIKHGEKEYQVAGTFDQLLLAQGGPGAFIDNKTGKVKGMEAFQLSMQKWLAVASQDILKNTIKSITGKEVDLNLEDINTGFIADVKNGAIRIIENRLLEISELFKLIDRAMSIYNGEGYKLNPNEVAEYMNRQMQTGRFTATADDVDYNQAMREAYSSKKGSKDKTLTTEEELDDSITQFINLKKRATTLIKEMADIDEQLGNGATGESKDFLESTHKNKRTIVEEIMKQLQGVMGTINDAQANNLLNPEQINRLNDFIESDRKGQAQQNQKAIEQYIDAYKKLLILKEQEVEIEKKIKDAQTNGNKTDEDYFNYQLRQNQGKQREQEERKKPYNQLVTIGNISDDDNEFVQSQITVMKQDSVTDKAYREEQEQEKERLAREKDLNSKRKKALEEIKKAYKDWLDDLEEVEVIKQEMETKEDKLYDIDANGNKTKNEVGKAYDRRLSLAREAANTSGEIFAEVTNGHSGATNPYNDQESLLTEEDKKELDRQIEEIALSHEQAQAKKEVAEAERRLNQERKKNKDNAQLSEDKAKNDAMNEYLKILRQINDLEVRINKNKNDMGRVSTTDRRKLEDVNKGYRERINDLYGQMPIYDKYNGTITSKDRKQTYNLTDSEIENFQQEQTNLENKKSESIARTNAQLTRQRGILEQLTNSFKEELNSIFNYQIGSRIFNELENSIRNVIEYTKQLDANMVDLQIASGESYSNIYDLTKQFNELGNELGRTTSEVMQAANDWLRAGYDSKEAAELTRASMNLSTLGMINSSDATSYLISMLKGWKLETEEVNHVVDKLTAVDMAAAVSAGDLAEGLSRANTSAQLAGSTMDNFIGYVTTIADVSQKSAASVGESMKTLKIMGLYKYKIINYIENFF